MSRARSASTWRTYGRTRILKAWGLPRSTFYERRRRPLCPRLPARRGPKTRYSDEDLLAEIRRTIQERPPMAKAAARCGRGFGCARCGPRCGACCG